MIPPHSSFLLDRSCKSSCLAGFGRFLLDMGQALLSPQDTSILQDTTSWEPLWGWLFLMDNSIQPDMVVWPTPCRSVDSRIPSRKVDSRWQKPSLMKMSCDLQDIELELDSTRDSSGLVDTLRSLSHSMTWCMSLRCSSHGRRRLLIHS
mgnify:CR=1 FL=1